MCLKTETGVLSFSMIKYSLMLLIAILMLDAFGSGRPISWIAFLEAAIASWLSMLLATYLIPYVLYRRTSAEWLLPFTPLLTSLALLVKPIVFTLDLIESLMGGHDEKPGQVEAPTSAENIEALITAGAEEGLIQEDDRKLIQSVVEFGDTTVREVMTPRPNIVAIPESSSLDDLRKLVIHEQYSRAFPVFEGSIDSISGFVQRALTCLSSMKAAALPRQSASLKRPIRTETGSRC